MEYFTGQLIFMPAYLLLLYVALRFISGEGGKGFFQSLNDAQSALNGDGNVNLLMATAGLVFQFIIAMVFINIPMIVALQLGGKSTEWAHAAKEKVRGKMKEWGGRYTYSLAASKLADTDIMKTAASKNFIAASALRGLRGTAKNYEENSKKKGEERAKFGESLGYNKSHVNYLDNSIKSLKDNMDEQDRIINDPSSTPAQINIAKDQKKTYQKAIRKIEGRISEEKRSRQDTYSHRLDPRDVDPITGKLKPMSMMQRAMKGKGFVSKYETSASSQIHIKNREADIEDQKKSIDDKKKDQTKLKDDIKRLDDRERRPGGLTGPETIRRDALKNDLYTLLNGDPATGDSGLINMQKEVREMENEVKKFKNLS